MNKSLVWWNEVKKDSEKLNAWLKDQYHGEITAANRIRDLASTVENKNLATVLSVIAAQEEDHAGWVKELLISRGLKAEVLQKEERYWSKTLPKEYKTKSLQQLAAIGAHAEKMRLDRINVIASDETAPSDIRKVFQRILPQEMFHEKAFRDMAGDVEMSKAMDAHKEGLAALGLLP